MPVSPLVIHQELLCCQPHFHFPRFTFVIIMICLKVISAVFLSQSNLLGFYCFFQTDMIIGTNETVYSLQLHFITANVITRRTFTLCNGEPLSSSSSSASFLFNSRDNNRLPAHQKLKELNYCCQYPIIIANVARSVSESAATEELPSNQLNILSSPTLPSLY